MKSRMIPAENFLRTLENNVCNKNLSDSDFRKLINNTLFAVDYTPTQMLKSTRGEPRPSRIGLIIDIYT